MSNVVFVKFKIFIARCSHCHTIDKDGLHVFGPNLNGIFGRKIGTVTGYTYRASYSDNPLVWSDKTFLEYFENPLSIIPGKKMFFTGLKMEEERKDLLAYLKSATN